MKIIKSVKELPSEYTLPNNCPVCGKYTGLYWLSKYKWVVDGDDAVGCCSMKCARRQVKADARED